MKILFVGHAADLYGACRCQLRLIGRFVRDGHEVLVVLPGRGPLEEPLAKARIPVRIFPGLAIIHRRDCRTWRGRFRLLAKFPTSFHGLNKIIREFKPDMVHTNASVQPTCGWSARVCRVPHVQHMREFYGDFPGLWGIYQRQITRNADAIVVCSVAVAAQFAHREKIHVFHEGFPAAEITGASGAAEMDFRSRFGIPSEAPLAGVIGRIKLGRKGQEIFLRAAALLKDRFPAARFVIVGAPFPGNESHEAELRRIVAESGIADRVVFCGEITDVAPAYSALDVVVMSSGTPEPFGGVVIEAMAHGRAVVGTDIGGTTEQIADGETGLLIPPNDPASMAAAMAKLFSDGELRSRMGTAGRERYLKFFEFESFYAKMLALFREVGGRGRAGFQ